MLHNNVLQNICFSMFVFSIFLFSLISQVVGVQRDSCCRMATVCQWQSVVVVSHQATGRSSSALKRNFPLTVTLGENSFVSILFIRCDKSKLQVWACRKAYSSWSVTLAERQSRLSDLIAVQVCESKLLSHFFKHLHLQCVWEWHSGVHQSSLPGVWALEPMELLLSFLRPWPEDKDTSLPGHRGRSFLCWHQAVRELWYAIMSRSDMEQVPTWTAENVPFLGHIELPENFFDIAYQFSTCVLRVSLQWDVCWASGHPGVSAAPHVVAGHQCGTRQSFESQSLVGRLVLDHLNSTLSVTPTAACLVTQTQIHSTFMYYVSTSNIILAL